MSIMLVDDICDLDYRDPCGAALRVAGGPDAFRAVLSSPEELVLVLKFDLSLRKIEELSGSLGDRLAAQPWSDLVKIERAMEALSNAAWDFEHGAYAPKSPGKVPAP